MASVVVTVVASLLVAAPATASDRGVRDVDDGIVHGRVRMADGAALSTTAARHGSVRLKRYGTDEPVRVVALDAKGRYELAGLGAGTYRIKAASGEGRLWASAKRITLASGQKRRIDFGLKRATTVKGTIVLRGVTPPVTLTVQRLFGATWRGVASVPDVTASGDYTVYAPAGRKAKYRVAVSGEGRTAMWWSGSRYGTSDEQKAKVFAVKAGGTVRGKDIDLVRQRATATAVDGKAGRRKARIRVAVSGVGTTAVPVGRAAIYHRGKRVATATIRDGRANFTVKNVSPGRRFFVIRYHGSPSWVSSVKRIKLTIR